MLTDFQSFCTVKIKRKFVVTLLLKILQHLKCVATLPSEISAFQKQQLKKTICYLWQHIVKKLTTKNNLFIVSLIVQSNCYILQFSHQMFNMSVLLLDDALKPVSPLTIGAINQTLRQFAPLSDDRLLHLVDWLELSTVIDHLLKGPLNSIIDRVLVRAVWAHMSGSTNVDHALVIVVAGLSAMFDISQGNVATHITCGGIFSNSVTTDFFWFQ